MDDSYQRKLDTINVEVTFLHHKMKYFNTDQGTRLAIILVRKDDDISAPSHYCHGRPFSEKT